MNELGISFVWLAGQVTLLCMASAAIYLVARRRHPSAGATAALTGLVLTAALTLSSFSHWPRWSLRTEPAGNAAETTLSKRPADPGALSVASQGDDAAAPHEQITPATDVELESASQAAWTAFWQNLGRDVTQSTTHPKDGSVRWSGWLAMFLILTVVLGGIRLAVGWITVRRCLRRSTAIDDHRLAELLDVLRAELGERRMVCLRESHDIASAATIGWRKPVILLPQGWHNWSDAERRIVLAHELAHVVAGDAATWLAAQFGLLLHFYHPLVHWLTHRLRLEQELAADALAARLSGNAQTYLTTLAELAVRQPDHPLAWPARAFLPTRGTLLRRIEMLRDTKSPPLPSSSLRRATVIALTLIAGVFVAGLRPPEAQQAIAQQPEEKGAASAVSTSAFNLENVPGTTKVLLGLRPAQFANRPELQPLLKFVNESIVAENTGIRFEDIDQVLFMIAGPVVLEAGEQLFRGPVIEVRMKQPTDFTAFAEEQDLILIDAVNAVPNPPRLTTEQRLSLREHKLLRQQFLTMIREEDTEGAMDIVDERTMLYGLGKDLWTLLDDLDRISRGRPDWLEKFETVADDQACVVWDVAAFRPYFQMQFQEQPNPVTGLFVPMWQNAELVIGGMRMDETLVLTINGWSLDAPSAQKLQQAVTGLAPLGRGLLESTRANLMNVPADRQPTLQRSIGLAESALESLNVKTQVNRVSATVTGDFASVGTLTAALLPAVEEAREAARRTQSRNQIHNFGIALHNYHDKHGSFPPPVLMGPDGKTKHSWRIAVLPYIDEQELYDEYDLNQPWNSDHNKKVLSKMPELFRHPNDKSGSTNTAYFCVVGENTMFDNGTGSRVSASYGKTESKPEPDEQVRSAGVRVRDIIDGTSNTLMIVEAKRNIPWTKPEDIPFSAADDPPKLGGWYDDGFFIGLGDGAALFVKESIDDTTLKNLILRNDGNVIDLVNKVRK